MSIRTKYGECNWARLIDNDRIVCRCTISGKFNGREFTYQDAENETEWSQYIWLENNDPSRFWWEEGNMACDCNRSRYLPDGWIDEIECGGQIEIYSVIPFDDCLPKLYLETT